MKNILLICLCSLSIYTIQAQYTWNRIVNKSYKDAWSAKSYATINSENRKRLFYTTANIKFANQVKDVITHQKNELTSFSRFYYTYTTTLTNFVKSRSFNSSSGYNSFGYIVKKYPVINPLNPGDLFKNKMIRNRLYNKLESESKNIYDYLDLRNPIPEGERIFMVLSALENVINITLENETY